MATIRQWSAIRHARLEEYKRSVEKVTVMTKEMMEEVVGEITRGRKRGEVGYLTKSLS